MDPIGLKKEPPPNFCRSVSTYFKVYTSHRMRMFVSTRNWYSLDHYNHMNIVIILLSSTFNKKKLTFPS